MTLVEGCGVHTGKGRVWMTLVEGCGVHTGKGRVWVTLVEGCGVHTGKGRVWVTLVESHAVPIIDTHWISSCTKKMGPPSTYESSTEWPFGTTGQSKVKGPAPISNWPKRTVEDS